MSIARGRPCDEVTIKSTPAAGNCAARAKPWVLVATILASSISYIDESIVNVALPAIETDLATSVVVIQWLVNAYTLCLAAFLLAGGAAGDLFGRRRVFIIGMTIFALASLLCGLSFKVTQLILARAIQGIGAALLVPCSLAIIGATFDESERGKAIGTWAGFSAISAAVGPLLGGWIVDHFSWRWIFFINPLLASVTIWIALRHVPESRDDEAKGALDWRGSLLAFVALGSLTFGLISAPMSGWADPKVLASLLAGLIALGLFVREELRAPVPILPLALFRSRTFTAVNLLTLLLYGALGGALFFLPFALIQVEGFSTLMAGAAFLPVTIIMGTLSRWSGGLLDRFGAKWLLIVGPSIAAVGFGLMALSVGSSLYWAYFLPISVLAFGMVISAGPITTTVINAVPTHQAGIAAGVDNAVASVASLLAVAVLGALALALYNGALDHQLVGKGASEPVKHAIEVARGQFVNAPALSTVEGSDRKVAENIIKESLAASIRQVMLLISLVAFAGAACGVLIPGRVASPGKGRPLSGSP